MFTQTCCREHKHSLPHHSVCMRWRRSATVYTGTLQANGQYHENKKGQFFYFLARNNNFCSDTL